MKHCNIFYLLLGVMIACKHDAVTDDLLPTINVSKTAVKAGDSVFVTVSNSGQYGQIQISPNMGELQSNGWYKAPSTVLVNGTIVALSLVANNSKATVQIELQKVDVNDTTVSFNQTIMPLLVANCNFSGCHGNGSSAGKTNLSNYTEVFKHVTIFQPQKSILYTSLLKPDVLRRMPPAGPLHSFKTNWVLKWIEQGALNN